MESSPFSPLVGESDWLIKYKSLKIATPSVLKITVVPVSSAPAARFSNLSSWPLSVSFVVLRTPMECLNPSCACTWFPAVSSIMTKITPISTEADAGLAMTSSGISDAASETVPELAKICVAVPGRTDKVSELAAITSSQGFTVQSRKLNPKS